MDMDTPTVVALVSSVTSLVVALISFVQSRKIASQQLDADKYLQKQNNEYEKRLEALRISQQEMQSISKAVEVFWSNLQLVKQSIDIILVEEHPEHEDAVEVLKAASKSLLAGYADMGHLLPDEIRGLWHGAKNYGLEINDKVSEYMDMALEERKIPRRERNNLLRQRKKLTEYQELLKKYLKQHELHVMNRVVDILSIPEDAVPDRLK